MALVAQLQSPWRLLRPSLIATRPMKRLFHAAVPAPASKPQRPPRASPKLATVKHRSEDIGWSPPANTVNTLPRKILETAIANNRIDVPYEATAHIAKELCAMGQTSLDLIPLTMLRTYETDHALPNLTSITRIAIVLGHSEPHRPAAVRALRSLAVNASEPLATMAVAHDYLRGKRKVDLKEQHRYTQSLLRIANEGTHPHAMMLYSYFAPRKDALSWLERAHTAAQPIEHRSLVGRPYPLAMLLGPEIPAPWCAYADALANLNRQQESLDAIKVGMEKFDDPLAYKRFAERLAQDIRSGKAVKLADYEHSLLKSAMDHDGMSCYLLGNLYLTRHLEARPDSNGIYGRSSEPLARRHHHDYYRLLAVEWYELAIQAKLTRPALILAALWRREGKPLASVERYLRLVELDREGSANKARELRERWTEKEFSVDIADLMV